MSDDWNKLKHLVDLSAENARLKAEVERLTVAADWKTPARKIQALEAEVERLQQDLVAVKYYGELLEFLKANAAKEGKQP